jgi:uncharacterized phage protein (predicted DNA packaging)
MIVSLEEVKNWLRIDFSDDDTLLSSLISASETYLKNATGIEYKSDNHLAKLLCMVLISDWYENRELVGRASDQVRPVINSILMQLTYGGETS